MWLSNTAGSSHVLRGGGEAGRERLTEFVLGQHAYSFPPLYDYTIFSKFRNYI